ncbi:MAG: exodeoxyribonuclease VII small subunit [Bacteroidales bacterium]|nr:exodeoxyribonuclease VII small subunit [Bacteroidales bacterium]
MKEQESYEKSYQELVEIVKEIESENIDIDSLSEKVQRAKKLITFCKNKLKVTEKEVTEILKTLDKSDD